MCVGVFYTAALVGLLLRVAYLIIPPERSAPETCSRPEDDIC